MATMLIPCLKSSAMTAAIDGGFKPSGRGVHGFARASLMTASRISCGGRKSEGLLQAAAPAAALISESIAVVWYNATGKDSSINDLSLDVMPGATNCDAQNEGAYGAPKKG